MSLSLSRGRRVKCFGPYHDDLCIFSVPLICWLKQESWLGRKCYHSRVNNILQILCQKRWAVWISVRSWAIKLLHKIPISALCQLAVHNNYCFLLCEQDRSLSFQRRENTPFFLIIVLKPGGKFVNYLIAR